MKTMIKSYLNVSNNYLKDVVLLFIRILMAYCFYGPATMKWADMGAIAGWFESMNYPLPTVSAYLAAGTEMAAVVLLPLGLFTRIISALLVIVMIVAITTVHWSSGFEAGKNGFEIPLYYMMFFLLLHFGGAGKLSVDHFLFKNKYN